MKELKLPRKKAYYLPLGGEVFTYKNKDFNTFNLLYVGVLNMRDIEKTIYGLSKFYNEFSNKIAIRYDIVGYGKAEDEMKIIKAINNTNLQNIVFFHGKKSRLELKDFFLNANIGIAFIPLKKYYDLQPSTKIFEYLLSGLYVIATNTQENKKIINDLNGMLCDDSIEGFYEALKKTYFIRNKISSSEIRKTAENFKWDKIIINYLLPVLK